MSFDVISSLLLGQADQAVQWTWWRTVLLLCIALPIPALLGHWLAKWLRMKDYGWKLAVIFCALASASVIVSTGRLNLGVDLKGGVILIYEIDREALRGDDPAAVDSAYVDWGRLIQSITNRINPAGTKEIVVRRYGEWQIEIIIPEAQDIEIERIKDLISTAGSLEFRIVANTTDHPAIISQAEDQAADPMLRRSRFVRDGPENLGYWARVGREAQPVAGGILPFRVAVGGDILRDAVTGELLNVPPQVRGADGVVLAQWAAQQEIREIDVLMAVDDGFDVTGAHLGMVSSSWDETGRPSVRFRMRGQGIGLMGGLTGSNLPARDREFWRRLGIMLDGTLLSAPRVMSTISDQGQITGGFTRDEVEFLVGILQAGSLPAALSDSPISENKIGAVLGEMTIRKGREAIALSLMAVVVFILFWYRLAGLIACAALAANLLLVMAFVMLFRAALTLPGLAGLVLTVGMSVDANVLIYERIREERRRGSALRMAIRNGFDRATTTIVDANLTTLITAIVLYAIGTDQIRGFAVILILGILMSMFTAIFCARVVFELFERTRRLKDLRLRSIFPDAHVDFMSKRKLAAVASITLIVISMVGMAARGRQIFDIDFLGGTSVTMILQEPTTESEIRNILDPRFSELTVEGSSVQYSVNRVDVEGLPERTVWKIDSSLPDVDDLQRILYESFTVAKYSMEFGDIEVTWEEEPAAETVPDEVTVPAEPVAPPMQEEPAVPEEAAPAPEEAAPAPEEAAPAPEEAAPAPEEAAPAPEEAAPAPKEEAPAPEEAAPAPEEEAPAPKEEAPAPEEAAPAPEEAAPAPEEAAPAPEEAAPAPEEAAPAPEEAAPAPEEAAPAPEEAAPASEEAAPAPEEEAPAPEETEAEPDGAQTLRPMRVGGVSFVSYERGGPSLALADEEESAPTEEIESDSEPMAEEAQPAGEAVAEAPDAEDEALPTEDVATPDAETDAVPAEPSRAARRVVTRGRMTFEYEINGRTLQDQIFRVSEAKGLRWAEEDFELSPLPPIPDWMIDDSRGFHQWSISVNADEDQVRQVLIAMQERMAATAVWPSSNEIGGKVAGDTQALAIAALLTSLVGIIIYIWIRFQRVIFGLAAVVALIHDVLIVLGAIAVSFWLAGVLGFLQVQEFKISLPVVAAILTIIGYSLNDTIVVFDRIREVKGKSPNLTTEILNTSLNQTLSRTLLTSFTTFLVVSILYFFGGAGIHDFAYCLVVGVIVGTYSSIFVATPVLLWMSGPTAAGR
jgi:SecD/SecF fusion protein